MPSQQDFNNLIDCLNLLKDADFQERIEGITLDYHNQLPEEYRPLMYMLAAEKAKILGCPGEFLAWVLEGCYDISGGRYV